MNPEVNDAVAEIRATFPDAEVRAVPDGNEGAFVIVDPVPLGEAYVQDSSWVGFHITFQYPLADVYPHFVRPDLARSDGTGLGEGFAITSWNCPENRPVVQLSRRSNRLDPSVDTAAIKLLKVLQWLNKG